MDRAALLATLDAANRHVAEREQRIERQRRLVASLEQHGRGVSRTSKVARELLASMERSQRAHVGHRNQITAELARLDETTVSALITALTSTERWRDANIEGQDKS